MSDLSRYAEAVVMVITETYRRSWRTHIVADELLAPGGIIDQIVDEALVEQVARCEVAERRLAEQRARVEQWWEDCHGPWNVTEFGTECACSLAIVDPKTDECSATLGLHAALDGDTMGVES